MSKKRVLVISPYFPPSNAADMQRVRMSLPFFDEMGWDAEVVTVNERHSDMVKDALLLRNLPEGIRVHRVDAFSKKWTSRFGLGSIALRSLPFYRSYVNRLLRRESFDLIYFSTTQFPVCILGAYWKRKFGIPYVIDVQDPWHSTYYHNKPKAERPPKYWFSYRLNRWLEPMAMKAVDGLIAVSAAYIETLRERYPHLREVPARVIPFGAFAADFQTAAQAPIPPGHALPADARQLRYVGRGGHDLERALLLLFGALKSGLSREPEIFGRLRLQFIGTSYAPAGTGKATIAPLAEQMGLGAYVTEQTDRVGFYPGLRLLLEADAVFIPGSDDPAYTPSKIYPYVLAGRPLLAVFAAGSPAAELLREVNAGTLAEVNDTAAAAEIGYRFLRDLATNQLPVPVVDAGTLEPYSARAMTRRQCELFDAVLSR